ncbi:hypothetical protein CTAYLR_006029 [Chrysophaeum taylorii]|uniref:Threonine dehydratase n=1 Tax=Chrysophaeum taylorii TaxID=2483200 RepID=A0AAD7UJR2_9STRA|nr:hypothetical protein CTAYLR_006029 [Chrysophaeum taylorii]
MLFSLGHRFSSSAARAPVGGAHDWYLREILNAFRVYDVAHETALTPARALSERLGCEVLIKREDMQPVFSFKIRGAYNKIAQLSPEERSLGVVACSAGNHAQGVALSCRYLGTRAVIVMPRGTPRIKVDAASNYSFVEKTSRRLFVLIDRSIDRRWQVDAAAEAARLVREEGLTLIHPFDDPAVIAGQGTIGLDGIFCCVGGGGLLAGVAAYVKQVRPDVKVYGVEASDAAGMTTSLNAGRRVALDRVGLFADGAAVRRVGEETFRLASELVDGMVTVDNDEICAAIKASFQDARCVLEPAGALAVAGLRKHVESFGDLDPAATFVAVASGANMDFDRLRFVSERADRSEVRLSLRIPERPGAFRELYSRIFPCNVTEFSYRFNRQDRPADIILAFQPQTNKWFKHVFLSTRVRHASVFRRLSDAGYEPRDITNDELVSAHVRHLAGGRAPFVENERVFRFEFPEAPGALDNFLGSLDAASTDINCSLFHYRNYGHDFGRVLVALQVPSDYVLDAFLANLGYRYVEETHNPNYRQFLSSDA